MKKIAAIFLAGLATTSMALAHNMEGGSTKGLFGLKPEYIHVLLNPLPTYGLGIGIVILAAGFLARNRSARFIGLVVTAICAASAWPVLFYGQRGYNDLYPLLDTESQQWLDAHMYRAEHFIYFFYATAIIAIAALAFLKKFPKAATGLAILTLAIGAGSLGIGGWIARAGGEVSHSEFRGQGPPPNVPAHDDMKMPMTNDVHQTGVSTNVSKENKVPDSIEGIWTELHRHYAELESAVTAGKLAEVHPHAVAINNLTAKLVEIVHPDHKAVVQSGVDAINRAANDLHKASHTSNNTAAKESLKQLGDSLQQLEEQMKKQ